MFLNLKCNCLDNSETEVSSMSRSSKNSKTTDNSILSFIKQAKANSISNTPNNCDGQSLSKQFQVPKNQKKKGNYGIYFPKDSTNGPKNKHPLTCVNSKDPNNQKSFKACNKLLSPQAKPPSSTKEKKRDNMKSNSKFVKKRLGEKRLKEIMDQIDEIQDFSFDKMKDILTEGEKDLGMFIFTILKDHHTTPKTSDSSLKKINVNPESSFAFSAKNPLSKNPHKE